MGDRNRKIKITEGQLWDFVYKEICKVYQLSLGQFAMSEEYYGFKRRFHYYMNKQFALHENKDDNNVKEKD